jgi:uncharacterized OB-fold protein
MAEAESSAKRMVPLREGLFRVPSGTGDKGALLGSRCPDCGACFFPRRAICLACGRRGMEDTELSTRGKVWTYTIAGQTPPGSLIEAPYVLAVVELPEKVMVEAPLADCEPDAARVGMDVEFVLVKMREDEEGNDLVAFKFRPA